MLAHLKILWFPPTNPNIFCWIVPVVKFLPAPNQYIYNVCINYICFISPEYFFWLKIRCERWKSNWKEPLLWRRRSWPPRKLLQLTVISLVNKQNWSFSSLPHYKSMFYAAACNSILFISSQSLYLYRA